MKIICIISITCLVICCKTKDNGEIKIDLTGKKTEIRYSDFVDSVSYVTLYTDDSCIISNIYHFFTDGSYTILSSRGGNGISIFHNNHLIHNINHYGRGPGEFMRISSFCLDKVHKQICIHDELSGKILKYDYDGSFICEFPFEEVIRDFANVDGYFICIQPAYLKQGRAGIWSANPEGKFEKMLLACDPDHIYEVIYPHYYNYVDEGISYYDRYDNRLLSITPDTMYVKYRFNLIPALPSELKKSDNKGLQDYFMLASCYDFEDYLLLFYGSTDQYYQVLFNKTDSSYRVTDNIINDILPTGKSEVSTHHVDKNTLVVELGAEEEDYNVHLQILHVGKKLKAKSRRKGEQRNGETEHERNGEGGGEKSNVLTAKV